MLVKRLLQTLCTLIKLSAKIEVNKMSLFKGCTYYIQKKTLLSVHLNPKSLVFSKLCRAIIWFAHFVLYIQSSNELIRSRIIINQLLYSFQV